jgi:hypothetical protein
MVHILSIILELINCYCEAASIVGSHHFCSHFEEDNRASLELERRIPFNGLPFAIHGHLIVFHKPYVRPFVQSVFRKHFTVVAKRERSRIAGLDFHKKGALVIIVSLSDNSLEGFESNGFDSPCKKRGRLSW